ncbi:MAG: InlB B-repeat-containing protein, partial [Bifidobacteriaceae bacterium]|nr:InlB B-repeat-containing protein [Bifidobacteriaceae bacterium]
MTISGLVSIQFANPARAARLCNQGYINYFSGDGSSGNPYQINNGADLDCMRQLVNDGWYDANGNDYYYQRYWKLNGVIDISSYGDDQGWIPIGTDDDIGTDDGYYFSGTVMGPAVITGMSMNRTDRQYVGLFGYLDDEPSTFRDLALVGGSITVDYDPHGDEGPYAAALFGGNYGTTSVTVERVYSDWDVQTSFMGVAGGIGGSFYEPGYGANYSQLIGQGDIVSLRPDLNSYPTSGAGGLIIDGTNHVSNSVYLGRSLSMGSATSYASLAAIQAVTTETAFYLLSSGEYTEPWNSSISNVYRWNGASFGENPYAPFTDGGEDNKQGTGVSCDRFADPSWWTNTAGFDANYWDFSYVSQGYVPILKGLTSDGVAKMKQPFQCMTTLKSAQNGSLTAKDTSSLPVVPVSGSSDSVQYFTPASLSFARSYDAAASSTSYMLKELGIYYPTAQSASNYAVITQSYYNAGSPYVYQWDSTATTPIICDCALQASFASRFYTIAYNSNGGGGALPPSQTGTFGVPVTLANDAETLTRVGYELDGWATSADGPVAYQLGETLSSVPHADGATVTLYAHWHQVNYTVHFDVNGGIGCALADQLEPYNQSFALP